MSIFKNDFNVAPIFWKDSLNSLSEYFSLQEIQRFANIFPINLLRTVAEDVVMGKYYYPAGTLCIPQISIAMNDPVNFEKPKEFRPDRFLEDDGFTLKK